MVRFFATARERHSIYLRRNAGQPYPWSEDQILNTYRFCNVFRELDRTTTWFREHVREPMRAKPEVLLATVLFRWFNRITTGEACFSQPDLFAGSTAFEYFLNRIQKGYEESAMDVLRSAILKHCGSGPYVTGAYIIQTRGAGKGLSKLDGVIKLVHNVATGSRPFDEESEMRDWESVAHLCLNNPREIHLEHVWRWLTQFPSMGPFMAQEVVMDLRHTHLLNCAPDINSWGHAGPGAARGLNRIRGRELEQKVPAEQQLKEMQKLLMLAWSNHHFWPREWPRWELHEVEFWLCEFDKYERARLNQGKPKQVFRP